MVFMATDLDQRLRRVFGLHVGEGVTIVVGASAKKGHATLDGFVVEVFPHGVLVRRRRRIDIKDGVWDEGRMEREFISFVDFYTLHARVTAGDVKGDIETLIPEVKNATAFRLRDMKRDIMPAVLAGA